VGSAFRICRLWPDAGLAPSNKNSAYALLSLFIPWWIDRSRLSSFRWCLPYTSLCASTEFNPVQTAMTGSLVTQRCPRVDSQVGGFCKFWRVGSKINFSLTSGKFTRLGWSKLVHINSPHAMSISQCLILLFTYILLVRFIRLYIFEYKFINIHDVILIVYFHNSTVGVIMSWSGRVTMLLVIGGSARVTANGHEDTTAHKVIHSKVKVTEPAEAYRSTVRRRRPWCS